MNLLLVFEQGDPVLIGVFLTLILMSIMTWSILLHRGTRLWQMIRGSRRFLVDFWECRDWNSAYELAQAQSLPAAEVAQAGIDGWRQYRSQAHGTLGAACGLDEFLVRVIRNAMTQAVARLEKGMTVKEMVNFLGVSRQNLTAVLNRLERSGLVERTRIVEDGRIRRIRLTKKGAETWAKMLVNIRSYYEAALADFTTEESLQLYRLLDRLRSALSRL